MKNHWDNVVAYDVEKDFLLDYDNYDPDGTLNAQIILIMPEIVPPWQVTYVNEVETRYNNNVQVTEELLEIIDPTTIDAGT